MSGRRDYQGIIYPDRAERLGEFGGYRVFLNHWSALCGQLGQLFEGVSLRGDSRVLAIHGAADPITPKPMMDALEDELTQARVDSNGALKKVKSGP